MCTFFGVKHMRLDYLLPSPEQMMWGKHGLTSVSSKMRSPPTSRGCRAASHGPQRTCRAAPQAPTCWELPFCPIIRQIQCRVKATRAETPTSLQICSKTPSYTLSRLHYIENNREADPGVMNHMTISQCLFMNRGVLIVLYKYRQTQLLFPH